MKRNNELLTAINKYFSSEDGTNIYYQGAGTAIKKFANIFLSGERFIDDAPDLFICKNNTAFITEHFEFDCYRVTRKGSQSRREQSRIDRLEKKITPTEAGAYFHDKIQGFSSYQDYVQNVCRNFNEHYLQISTYKKNLKNRGLISDSLAVKVLFFIEDTSPLGSMVVDYSNDSPFIRPICLGQCREFLSLLDNSPDVNYVLACSMSGSNKIVWFIDRSEISAYQKKSIEYSKMEFLNSEPQVLGFRILIPND
ncbi:hypothetical protein H8S23_02600 [Anaerofilum sp. BX8]|uniref:Uncharacterized protein n=1 Tax=Anaerofilum hominis TaxID=2763016 RepID=A0A923L0I2_9FIRM|nr:hypothetical protein [Anaerofilum hominis]MBC5580387.1 hypothetical protein [Anaerofilum hominis]